jgi:hypothetical protein
LPGVANILEAGLPPGNDHEYAAILPSGSVPVPANATELPGFTVAFPDGLVIVAVGAWLPFRRTNVATDGTPAEFTMNSM